MTVSGRQAPFGTRKDVAGYTLSPAIALAWFEDGDQLCFAFEDGRLSACWHFFKDNGRLRGQATYLGSSDLAEIEIFEVSHTDQPLTCAGPDVGV